MNDQEIIKLLTSYVGEEMTILCEDEMSGYDHIYSKVYKKRIRRMFWSEKYFGSKLHFGYMVRRIAVVVIIILSLFTANEVSARVFGFNPWKCVTSFLNDSKMDVKTYKDSADWSDTEADIIVRDFPVRLPKGFEKTAFEQSDTSLYAEWNKEGKEYLQYSRIILSDGMSLAMDGEYESKEKITICDYVGEYCVKGEESWIVWDDTTYNHMIISTKVEEPKELLLEMAESLYQ